MRVVLTIVGKDKVGITAKVSNALAEMNINIININQNITQGFFNMVLIADMAASRPYNPPEQSSRVQTKLHCFLRSRTLLLPYLKKC